MKFLKDMIITHSVQFLQDYLFSGYTNYPAKGKITIAVCETYGKEYASGKNP